MTQDYNETDAAIFAHKQIPEKMQKKYSLDQIGYLLDLVYEFYETNVDENQDNPTIDGDAMKTFINENISDNYCKQIEINELEQLLNADNDYMESIGLLEPENETEKDDDDLENDDDIVNIDEAVEEIYPELPQNIKNKYNIDQVYTILCIECDYINDMDDEFIDEEKVIEYIKRNAANEDIKISKDDIRTILNTESKVLDEE